jgi:hypothetical protein
VEAGRLDGSETGYGFGMHVEPACFHHSGRWAGYHNLVYLSRQNDSRIVILTNDRESDVWELVKSLDPSPSG